MIVTFDTMVLIWDVKRVSTKGQEGKIESARRLISKLQTDRIELALTSQVVAEYVGAFPVERQAKQYRDICRDFVVYPFDAKAAKIAAELLCKSEFIKELKDEFGVSRQVVKADMSIAATAIAAGVDTIYSDDRKLKKVAMGMIMVKPIPDSLPPTATQDELFE